MPLWKKVESPTTPKTFFFSPVAAKALAGALQDTFSGGAYVGDGNGGVSVTGGTVGYNDLVTGASLTGRSADPTKEGGAASNEANVSGGSTVKGDVTGAATTNQVATDNAATVEGSTVGSAENVGTDKEARVAGASTEDGTASGNHASVSGSTVNGSVFGGVSQSGEVTLTMGRGRRLLLSTVRLFTWMEVSPIWVTKT